MHTPRRWLSLLALLVALLAQGQALAAALTLRVFDVGQGDAMLVVSPTGKTVLIDGGPPEAGRRLAHRLEKLVKGPLDLIVMTHPHADHLGGMAAALAAVGARAFLEPGFDHPSPLYRDLLRALEARKVPLRVGRAGDTIDLGGGATMHLLAPREPLLVGTRSDANANSIVARVAFGRTAFYLAADSEEQTERRILESGEPVASDVYKVAHHGSAHSSETALLERIRPGFAVISVGGHNDYGHPARAALERLGALRAVVLRTDRDGEIVFESDGDRVTYSTEKSAAARPPSVTAASGSGRIASRSSRVFHRPECRGATHIRAKSRLAFPSREAALASGRRPARDCNP